ncbi:MAG: hypothetical protein M1821_004381 [Bathelium mastoideum]|nr:MAG: hypothetical protein M1821_004381 [Bathelium mastoideum]KAI9685311.1 MAG: hypothetical protein M1822_004684 [Bathelium mastoideum]
MIKTYARANRPPPRERPCRHTYAERSSRHTHAERSSRHTNAERPAKRRRVHREPRHKENVRSPEARESPPPNSVSTVPSSPPTDNCTSHGSTSTVTPPSSPPPLMTSERSHSTPTVDDSSPMVGGSSPRSRKVFSREPLRQTNGNARKRSRVEKKPRLVQTQIDLGGKIHKTCRTCGMEYIPSNEEDAALHKKFHTKNNNGIEVSKGFMEATQHRRLAEVGQWQHVVSISRSDPRVLRHQALETLQIACTELGSVKFDEKILWGQQRDEDRAREGADGTIEIGESSAHAAPYRDRTEWDRYKVYLLLRNKKCVGLCLAENICKAHQVVELDGNTRILQDPHAKSSAIAVSRDSEPAIMGISRIWTSNAHRNEGIATALLDCAAQHFLYGMEIAKEQIAFSQPTESGGRLARKWFGREYGWHVYMD